MKRNPLSALLRVIVLAVGVVVLTGSGLGPQGFTKKTWTKSELVEWYAKYRSTAAGTKLFGYKGSDADFHYFITRPVDSFFIPRVARTELHIEDERPIGRASSAPLFHYLVDPLQDFKKVPSP